MSFNDRKDLAEELQGLYKDKICLHLNRRTKKDPEISKHRFLVPKEMTITEFTHTVRHRINKLNPYESVFLMCRDYMLSGNESFEQLHYIYKNPDEILYLTYIVENTFG